MARITPKTNWADNDIPVAQDLNRIENNTLQSFNELDAEASARIAADNAEASARVYADITLQNNINTEVSDRIDADESVLGYAIVVNNNLQTNKLSNSLFSSGEYSEVNISNGNTYIIPGGTYYSISNSSLRFEIRDSGFVWRDLGVVQGLLISNGAEFRASNASGSTQQLRLINIAGS